MDRRHQPDITEMIEIVRAVLHAHLVELETAGTLPKMFEGSVTDFEIGEVSAMEHCGKVAVRSSLTLGYLTEPTEAKTRH